MINKTRSAIQGVLAQIHCDAYDSYTFSLMLLYIQRLITFQTVIYALKTKPHAVCGRRGYYAVGRGFEQDWVLHPPAPLC
jgi:hypothetical protein